MSSWQTINKQALTNTKVLHIKTEKWYKIRNMNQLVIICVWTVRGTAICFGISLRKQFEENARFCCLLACVCIMTTLEIIHPVIPWKRFKIYPKFEDVTPSAIFNIFGTQRYSFLLASKRRSIQKWTLLKIPRGGDSCLVDTAIKDFFSRGIYALVERRRERVERGGNYRQD
jgi:hypothetical protein